MLRLLALAVAGLVLLGCAQIPGQETVAEIYRVIFRDGSSELPPDVEPKLDLLAQKIRQDRSQFLVVTAFAGTAKDDRRDMLRLSLERVLRVRAALMDAGLASGQIDIRACGYRETEAPPDRVDIFIAEHPVGPGACGPKPTEQPGLPSKQDEPQTIAI